MATGLSMQDVMVAGIAFFLLAIILPIAISTVANSSTVNWDASVVTIFQTLLPIIVVIGIAIKFVPKIRGD